MSVPFIAGAIAIALFVLGALAIGMAIHGKDGPDEPGEPNLDRDPFVSGTVSIVVALAIALAIGMGWIA